jgi:hypothetical protein
MRKVRVKPETTLVAAMATLGVTGVIALILEDIRLGAHDPVAIDPVVEEPVRVDPVRPRAVIGAESFQAMGSFCNPIGAQTHIR